MSFEYWVRLLGIYRTGLDLPAEVSFRSFILWELKGPVMFWKSLGPSVKKKAELCLENTVRLYAHMWVNAPLAPQIKTVTQCS